MDVALRVASILKIRFFLYCLMSYKWQKTIIWLDLSIGSRLELFVLKNAAERTSQLVKCVWSPSHDHLRSFGRSVARLFGRSVARSLARWLTRSLGNQEEIGAWEK